ncbi:MAG: hypothetical protein ACW98Y_09965 [Candidatus Thorarchaeota archaeon]|jgi:hypothetical protein
MESDDNRSDEYWMGVRDALRMVDSFLKWSNANKERAKPLEEFLYDGLVAAAKRCESCLHKQLGIGFSSDEEAEAPDEEPTFDSMPSSTDTPKESLSEEDDPASSPPEIILEPEGFDDPVDVPIEIEPEIASDDSVRIESMSASDDTLTEDSIVHGEPRDFSDDFRLTEPDPLVVGPTDDGIEIPEATEDVEPTETVDIVIDDSIEDTAPETPPQPEEEETPVERPKYAWETPSDLPEALEGPPPAPEIPPPEAPPEVTTEEPKVWSPMDDPSPETLDDEESTETEEEATGPPPPPPPESEESEEERRRRARRLFFGG